MQVPMQVIDEAGANLIHSRMVIVPFASSLYTAASAAPLPNRRIVGLQIVTILFLAVMTS
jgi:hypothetical protein